MASVAQTSAALTAVHAEYLAGEHQALEQLERWTRPAMPTARTVFKSLQRPVEPTILRTSPAPSKPVEAPRQFDREALVRFATGKISEA